MAVPELAPVVDGVQTIRQSDEYPSGNNPHLTYNQEDGSWLIYLGHTITLLLKQGSVRIPLPATIQRMNDAGSWVQVRVALPQEISGSMAAGTWIRQLVADMNPAVPDVEQVTLNSGTLNVLPSVNGQADPAQFVTGIVVGDGLVDVIEGPVHHPNIADSLLPAGNYGGIVTDRYGRVQAIGQSILRNAVSANGPSVNVGYIPANIVPYSAWVVIDAYGPDAEMRQIEARDGNTLFFPTHPLARSHTLNAPVLFTADSRIYASYFGAKGDGASDDSAAFTRAIAEAKRFNGGEVHVGRGFYKANILLDGDNIALVGEAPSNTDAVLCYIQGFDPAVPTVQVGTGTGLVRGCRIENISLNGGKVCEIGLYLAAGTYGFSTLNLVSVSFTKYCLKIGDVGQQTFISYINFNGLTYLQAADSATDLVATLAIYGNSGSKYTTAVFFNGLLRLNQIEKSGTAILIDSNTDSHFIGGYIHARHEKGIKFASTNGVFPRMGVEQLVVDNGDGATGVSVELLSGFDSLATYFNGSIKIVGLIKKYGGITYSYSGFNLFRDGSWLQEGRSIGSFDLAPINHPDSPHADLQADPGDPDDADVPWGDAWLRSNSGRDVWILPGNSKTFGTHFKSGVGIIIGVFTKTTKPPAEDNPGALIAVSNENAGFTLEYSDGTDWKQVLSSNGISTFVSGIGVRSQNNGQAAGAYVPQQAGDSAPTIYAGGIVSGYNQIGVRAASDSAAGIEGESNSGPGVLAVSRGDTALHAIRDGGAVGSYVQAVVIERQLDAAAANGVGLMLELQAPANDSGTNLNGRILSQIRALFDVADKDTRTALLQFFVGDAGVAGAGTVRKALTLGANGAVPTMGMYDHDPVAQQTIAAVATNPTETMTLANSIRTILLNRGDVKP